MIQYIAHSIYTGSKHTKQSHFHHALQQGKERKEKEEYLYTAICTTYSLKALRHGSQKFICKLHHACLSFVSVQQMAPPLTDVADIQLQLTTYLSTLKGWKAEWELAWLVDLQRTVYLHKWPTVRYRLSARQGNFTNQRLTFYHCATQLTSTCLPSVAKLLSQESTNLKHLMLNRCTVHTLTLMTSVMCIL